MFQIPLLALTHIHAVIILLYYSLEHCYRKRKDRLLSQQNDHGHCVSGLRLSTGATCACVRWAEQLSCHVVTTKSVSTHIICIPNPNILFTSYFLSWIARSSSYLSPSRLYILCQYIWQIVCSSAKEKHNHSLRHGIRWRARPRRGLVAVHGLGPLYWRSKRKRSHMIILRWVDYYCNIN